MLGDEEGQPAHPQQTTNSSASEQAIPFPAINPTAIGSSSTTSISSIQQQSVLRLKQLEQRMTRGGEEEQVGQLFLAAPTISSSAVSDELVVVDETDNEEDETDDDGGVCSENETVIRESPPPPPPQPRTLVGINNIIPHPHPPPPPSNLPDLLDEFKQLCSETKTLQFPIVAGLAAAAADATTKTANLEKKTVRKFTPAEDELIEKGVALFGTGDWDALLVWAASSFQLVSQSSLDRTAIQLRNRWKRITQKKRIQLQQQQQQHEIVALPSHPLPPNNDLPNAMDISSTITDISAAAHPISDPLVRRESPVPVAGGGGCTLPHSAASTPDHHRQQNNGIIRITSSSTASLVVPPVNNSPDFIQLQIHPLTSDNNNISAGTSNIPATPHRKTKRIDDYFIRVGDNVTSSASAMAVTTAQQNSSTTSGPTSGSSSTTQSPLLDNTLLTTTVDSRQSLNNEQLQHQQSQHHDPHLVYPQKRARVVSSSSSDNNNTHTTPFRPPSLLFPAPSSFSSSSDQQQQDTLLSFQQTQQYLRRIEQLEVENRQWMAKASDCEETATRERAAYEKRISELEARIAHKDDRTRNILIDLLGRQASQKASQTRHRNLDNSIKLASVVVERNGLDGFRDRWVEGSKFRELRLAMAKIDKEKEELERKKKSLRKRAKPAPPVAQTVSTREEKQQHSQPDQSLSSSVFAVPPPLSTLLNNNTPSSASSALPQQSFLPSPSPATTSLLSPSSSSSDPPEPSSIAEEVIKLRLTQLKKEEQELCTRLDRLTVSRDLHVREYRRIRDEDGSMLLTGVHGFGDDGGSRDHRGGGGGGESNDDNNNPNAAGGVSSSRANANALLFGNSGGGDIGEHQLQSRGRKRKVLNDRYLILELIGKGGFSEVYKAFDLVDMKEVALKIHSISDQWSTHHKESYLRHVIRETRIHKSLQHPRIVQLYDVFEIDRSTFATVMEYCEGSDLEFYLQHMLPRSSSTATNSFSTASAVNQGGNSGLSEREAKSIVAQLFSALRYLSLRDPPVIHFDLKPGNLMYHKGEIKITDFGLSKVVTSSTSSSSSSSSSVVGQGGVGVTFKPRETELTSHGAGTYWYLPPECFEMASADHPIKISSKVDVWSAGCIFYELLFGVKPFGNNKSQSHILKDSTIQKEAHYLTFPPKVPVSGECKDFIKRCLEYNKDLRPDVLTVCADPYLQLSKPAAASHPQ